MSGRFKMVGQPPSESDKVNLGYVFTFAALVSAVFLLGLGILYFCFGYRNQFPPASADEDLKKKVLKKLPKLTYSKETMAGKFSDCAICLNEFASGDEIRVLPRCRHGFHVACIDTWFESKCSCPYCRQLLAEPDLM